MIVATIRWAAEKQISKTILNSRCVRDRTDLQRQLVRDGYRCAFTFPMARLVSVCNAAACGAPRNLMFFVRNFLRK